MTTTRMVGAAERAADDEGSAPAILLARVAQVSRDGIAIARAGHIEWANEALAGMLGRPRPALVGVRLDEIVIEGLGESRPLTSLGALCHDGAPPVTGRLG